MTGPKPDFCDHCGLPLGLWPHEGESEGQPHYFCCYGCFIGWQTAHGGGEDAAAAGFLIRLGVGAFLAMNIMLFSLLLYSGALDGVDADLRPYVHGLLWVLTTPVLVILGGPFFKETMYELIRGRFAPSMLITLGSSAAYLYSALATLQASERVYFDTVAMVLVLFTLGRYLEASGRARATRSLRPMLGAERQQVRVVESGREKFLPLADVGPGMLVSIAPGERILIDGIVHEGVSEAEEASLTGEPRPVEKAPGSPVLAGSINCDGTLLAMATAGGLDSCWNSICRDVREALSHTSRAQQIAENAARAFVPLVAAIAAATFWFGWQEGSMESALMSSLAVLVVACPCALGLAGPLATSLAIAGLARRGILIRSGAVLETLAGIRTMALDKTGTLTTGRIQCLEIIGQGTTPEQALRHAASVTAHSQHPLSKAICDAAMDRGVEVTPSAGAEIVPGMGVCGCADGYPVVVGSARWLEEKAVRIPGNLKCKANAAAEQGQMVAFAAWRGEACALFTFGDVRHPDAGALVRALEKDGIEAVMLTGDGPFQAERFCRRIGVTRWFSELTPQEKREAVQRLTRDNGSLAMVGDGVNDALALTSSAVGIAVGNAAGLARETAEIVLPASGISLLPWLLETARITKRTIATNLIWAFFYNGVAIALAATGLLQPVIAAALMAGSSLFVVVNTLLRMDVNLKSETRKIRITCSGAKEIVDLMVG